MSTALQTAIPDFLGNPTGLLDAPTGWIVKDPKEGRLFIKQSPSGSKDRWKELTAGSQIYFDPDKFGVTGDGITDDSNAIQKMFDAVSLTGGVINFRVPGRYKLTKRVFIRSKYPVSIVSNMFGYSHAQLNPLTSGILIAGPNAGIAYVSPTANRNDGGGGLVRGLMFFDPTGGYSVPGANLTSGALVLQDFNLSAVIECGFQHINGTAIETQFCVMTDIDKIRIRYCGEGSKPAFWVHPTDATYTTQSLTITNVRSEVNHGSPYLVIDVHATDILISNYLCESDANIPGSNQIFLYCMGKWLQVEQSTMKMTSQNAQAVYFDTTSQFCSLHRVSIRAASGGDQPSVYADGMDHTIDGCFWNTGNTGMEILAVNHVTISNCLMISSGSIYLFGSLNTVLNNRLRYSTTTEPYWIDGADSSDTLISGNQLTGDLTGSSGGIRVSDTAAAFQVIGNTVTKMKGVGIQIESPNALVTGNHSFGNFGLPLVVAPIALGAQVFGNYCIPGPQYLQAINTVDPASVPANSAIQFTITVNDARRGDHVFTSFTQAVSGILFSAQVVGNNNVTITCQNITGTAIDLPSGTLRTQVIKSII